MRATAEARRQLTEAYAAAIAALDAVDAGQDPVVQDEHLLLPLSKAGEPLGVSRTTVFELADSGALPTVEIPGVSGRFVRRGDLEAFVAGLARSRRQRLRSTG